MAANEAVLNKVLLKNPKISLFNKPSSFFIGKHAGIYMYSSLFQASSFRVRRLREGTEFVLYLYKGVRYRSAQCRHHCQWFGLAILVKLRGGIFSFPKVIFTCHCVGQ
jgi:hypothetical protein